MVQIVYVSVKNLDNPIGGVIVQASHVAALNRAGFDAKLTSVYKAGRPAWISEEVPFCDSMKLAIKPGDVLVMHDSLPRRIFDRYMDMPVRRVLFCQNHYFLDGTLEPHERFSDFPIDAFLCVSEPIASHLLQVHGVESPVIVRPSIKAPSVPAEPKKVQVCYMPRKRLVEAGTAMYRLRYLYPEIGGTPFVSIHKKHPDDVAKIMSESAIFLSLSGLEGLGLPPLEAMAAGCVVVGYHGGGGLDYATARNGRWFNEETPDNLVHLLADTVIRMRSDSAAFSDLLAVGKDTAARYDLAHMETELLRFWRSFL